MCQTLVTLLEILRETSSDIGSNVRVLASLAAPQALQCVLLEAVEAALIVVDKVVAGEVVLQAHAPLQLVDLLQRIFHKLVSIHVTHLALSKCLQPVSDVVGIAASVNERLLCLYRCLLHRHFVKRQERRPFFNLSLYHPLKVLWT